MAANRNPKHLSDLRRWDAWLRVTCRRCPHYATFDPDMIGRMFIGRGWNTAWHVLGARFRCRECGVKGGEVAMVPPPLLRISDEPRELTDRERKDRARRLRG